MLLRPTRGNLQNRNRQRASHRPALLSLAGCAHPTAAARILSDEEVESYQLRVESTNKSGEYEIVHPSSLLSTLNSLLRLRKIVPTDRAQLFDNAADFLRPAPVGDEDGVVGFDDDGVLQTDGDNHPA